MQKSPLTLAVVLALALAILPAAPASAQTVRVIVDGSPVFFDQPPITTGGRVLIPLRGVFEHLGAFVQWNPATNTVLATRGGTQVQLTIGSRIAFVNGRQVALDVPAMIVGGRTLVPLRFVSEAMGARVDWDVATRTVFVTSGGGAQPPVPQPPVVQPPQPPVPTQSVIEGTVFQVDTANSRLFVRRGDQILAIIITADTAITGTAGSMSLSQLRPGDAVTVTLDAQGRAILVRSTTAGQPSGQVRITAVSHNAQGALRPGDTLMVRMRGTPGGQATFSIEGVAGSIPMTERDPGVYVGRYTITAQNSVQNARVFVTLNVGGQSATAQAPSPISVIGAAGSTLTIVSPAPGASVGAPIIIRGTAVPGSRVLVRVDYRGTLLVIPVSGSYGEFATTADASGNWQVTIQPSLRIPNAQLTITAQATDPLGRESSPATVQVVQS